jgi:DNA (cytosine-5)-methyltransferase 1
MKKYKVGSDFSGVGAMNQALNRLGIDYEEIFACEMDKYARNTFLLNYQEPLYYPDNVYNREIPDQPLDLYVSSPPCQSFSIGGKRLGKNDKRGILFFNTYDFIKQNNPRYFIIENVKGLLSDDNGKTFSEWINLLSGKSINGNKNLFPYPDALNYHIYWKVLNSKDYGVPQNRERVFIVGIRDDSDNKFDFPKCEHLKLTMRDILESNVPDSYYLSNAMIHYVSHNRNGDYDLQLNRTIANCITCVSGRGQRSCQDNYIGIKKLGYINQDSQGASFYDSNGISQTILAGSHGYGMGYIEANEYQIRRLTPRECFRLMDFPDTFIWNVSDTQAYKQAGNSIVVSVLEKIIKKLLI